MTHYCIRLLVQCLRLLIGRLVDRPAAVPFLPFLLPTITSLRFHPTTATNIRFFRLLFPPKHLEITQLLPSNNDCLHRVAVFYTVLVNLNDILLNIRSQVQKLHRLELAIFVRKNAIFREISLFGRIFILITRRILWQKLHDNCRNVSF